jgi:broad specificity phosphatase PhoE
VTTFYLIRHGAHDLVDRVLAGRSVDIGINDLGRQQAMQLAEQLAAAPIKRALSSPRRRARETAAALARARALQVEIASELDELDAGTWSGQSFDALERDPTWHDWNRSRGSTRPPAGESMEELQTRVVDYLCGLHRRHLGQHVALFSHAEPIRAALLYFQRIPLDDFLRVPVVPASVHTVVYDERCASVLPRELPGQAA